MNPKYEALKNLDPIIKFLAEKVMGWHLVFRKHAHTYEWYDSRGGTGNYLSGPFPNWNPLVYIEHAFQIVERLRHKQWTISMQGTEWYDGGSWVVEIVGPLGEELIKMKDIQRHDGKTGWKEPSLAWTISNAAYQAFLMKTHKATLESFKFLHLMPGFDESDKPKPSNQSIDLALNIFALLLGREIYPDIVTCTAEAGISFHIKRESSYYRIEISQHGALLFIKDINALEANYTETTIELLPSLLKQLQN